MTSRQSSLRRANTTSQRMATTITERAAAAGSCTEDDLRTAGFSDTEIKQHIDAARRIAAEAA